MSAHFLVSFPSRCLTMNRLSSGAVARKGWVDRQRRGRVAWLGHLEVTHRSPEVDELLPHLGHEGFLGHQGPVQALVELDQLSVHLRHLEHTRPDSEAPRAGPPQDSPTSSGPTPVSKASAGRWAGEVTLVTYGLHNPTVHEHIYLLG